LDEDFIQTVVGMNRLLKEGGVASWDDPFAYGEGSHEQRADEYHESHPDEPWGMFMYRFEKQDGTYIDKPFRIRRPEHVIQLLEACGFEVLNIPQYEEIENLQGHQNSDQFAESIENPLQKGVFKTSSDRMRWTVVARKVREVEDTESILSQLHL